MLFSVLATLLGAASVSSPQDGLYHLELLGRSHNIFPKPDRGWEHVIKGVEVETEKYGKLSGYGLRTKQLDPSRLAVDKVKQYTGYFDDEKQDKHLFFWFFESRNDAAKDPVILWLNGGPGCSSLNGLLLVIGPAKIDKNLGVVDNPFSWNNNASIIFLDQPVNTGFSYSSKQVDTSEAAGKDVYAFLALFFHRFPEYAKQDFHIAGESYGGHYVPVFASEILSHRDRKVNLRSVLIGNGLLDPLTQYQYYEPTACGRGGLPAVLNESACQSMAEALPRCESLIKSCYSSGNTAQAICIEAKTYCNHAMFGPYKESGRNVFDMRKTCQEDGPCYDGIRYLESWLNKREVMQSLGVEVQSFKYCNFDVRDSFDAAADRMRPVHLRIAKLLQQIPVLVYAGDCDFTFNWLGNQAWTNSLVWPGQHTFQNSLPRPLRTVAGNKQYGTIQAAGNLVFMRIFNAGHPLTSLKLRSTFFGDGWPASGPQRVLDKSHTIHTYTEHVKGGRQREAGL
ncbi:hypothetical protein CDD83_3746 [Cordyceps sp. RAO-2017]|nr:hypothetical protein CDD83_3746 [Cordyceps sp. RAO-2017]